MLSDVIIHHDVNFYSNIITMYGGCYKYLGLYQFETKNKYNQIYFYIYC